MKHFLASSIIAIFIIFNCYSQDQISTLKDTTNLDEIIVTGSRIPISRNWVSSPISVIDRKIIEKSNTVAILPTLMQQIPGLFVTSRGVAGYGVSSGAAGGINMRGFSGASGRLLILIDGHPQYATIYGHPIADSYNNTDIERVEVSRGAASVLYGSNAMGGAINLITRKVTQNGYHMKFKASAGSYGTQSYTLNNSFKKNNLTAFLGGSHEQTDGHRHNSKYNSNSGFAKIEYKLSGTWKTSANVSLTNFYSENPGSEASPMVEGWVDVMRGMAGLSLENTYGITSGAVNLYHNWGKHKIDDGYRKGETPQPYLFRSTDYMSGVNIYQAVNAFSGNTITAGFDAKIYGGNAYRNPDTEIYADHIKLNETAGYLFVQQAIWKFILNAGLRLENHNLYGYEWVPQTGLSYSPTEATNVKFSVSKGFRTPNMRELYMYAVANEELLPETSISYDFTISQRMLNNKLLAELNLYVTSGNNIIEVVAINGIRQNRNAGEFTNRGIEFSTSYQILDNLSFNGNYSFLHMTNIITSAPKNKLYAGIQYKPGKFTIDLNTQIVNKLYLSTGNNEVISNYNLINAQVAWKPFTWGEIFVKGDNLLNNKYQTMMGFPMPGIVVMGGISINI